MLIADTSPKGGGNLQKDIPMASNGSDEGTTIYPASCTMHADMVMPRNALALLYGDNHVCYHVFQNLTPLSCWNNCRWWLAISLWFPFFHLTPIFAWFSEKWFEKRTCYPSNSWRLQVIRKAFPQQPPAFANEMVSNTTFPGWNKKTYWSLGIFEVPNWTNSSLFKKTHATVEKMLPKYSIRLMRLVGWSPKNIAQKDSDII